jgi:hypothetical protein
VGGQRGQLFANILGVFSNSKIKKEDTGPVLIQLVINTLVKRRRTPQERKKERKKELKNPLPFFLTAAPDCFFEHFSLHFFCS